MKNEAFDRLTAFLSELERREIAYSLAHHRDEAVMVLVAVPGERWEIEFFGDGSVEIEKFISSGEIYGEDALSELFARYTDQEDHRPSSAASEDVELTAVSS
jgi:hypothetical protein